MQVFGEVPSDGEVSVPEELLAECQWQLRSLKVFHVTVLQLIIDALYVRVESDVLWHGVECEFFSDIEIFRLRLDDFFEWFPRLVDRSPGVSHRTVPSVFVLINGGFTCSTTVRMAVREREVGRVVRHGMPFGLYTHPPVGE